MALKVKVVKKGVPGKEKLYYGVGSADRTYDMEDIVSDLLGETTVSESDLYAVITKLKSIIIKRIENGDSVKLFQVGTFYPKIKTTGAKTAKEFSKSNIIDINLGFRVNRNFKDNLKRMKTKIEYPEIEMPENNSKKDSKK